jgi:hypothetical protein
MKFLWLAPAELLTSLWRRADAARWRGRGPDPTIAAMHLRRLVASASTMLALAGCGAEKATAPEPHLVFGFPSNWSAETSDTTSEAFAFGIDRGLKRSGAASGYLRTTTSLPADSAFIAFRQSIRATAYRGKRVRYRGYVRAARGAGDAALWLRVDGPGDIPAFDTRGVPANDSWTQATITADVPSNAVAIYFGAALRGAGELRVDDLRLEIVGSDVPVTAAPLPGVAPFDSVAVAAYLASLPPAPLNMGFDLTLPQPRVAAASRASSIAGRDSAAGRRRSRSGRPRAVPAASGDAAVRSGECPRR